MYKQIAILVLLLVAAAGQTCSASTLNNIASQTLTLAVGANGFTQREYVVTIPGSLGISSTIHVAFAIAGFQASCSQAAYSLGVDTVILENSNSRMKFSMNYFLQGGSGNPVETKWTRVKVSYLLVSDQFHSYVPSEANNVANYVWAGSVEITPNKAGQYGLYGPGSIFAATAGSDAVCGYLSKAPSTSTAKFDINCPDADAMVPHYYIMGFQFTPSTFTLGARAQIHQYNTKANNKVVFGTSSEQGWGPVVSFTNFEGSLKKLKVAIVLTTLVKQTSYPNQYKQGFGYSGVYMPIDMYNIQRPIILSSLSRTDVNAWNKERYFMPRLSYGIYGLASFKLNPSSQCSAIDIDVEIKDITKVILRTDNSDYLEEVFVAGDFYSGSMINGCNVGGDTPYTPKIMTQISTRIYKTIPEFAIDAQRIQYSGSTYKLRGKSLNSGSNTITYDIKLNYQGFIVGSTYKIDLSLKTSNDIWSQKLKNVPNPYIKWTTFIEDKTIYDVSITSTKNTLTFDSNNGQIKKSIGVAVTSTTPVVRFLVIIPRPISSSPPSSLQFIVDLQIKIYEYTTVYIPSTDCCQSKCPERSGINVESSLPSCIVCTGDVNLYYDPSTGICGCRVGFYDAVNNKDGVSCFPCLGKLCSTCAASTPTQCTSCVAGAVADSNNICNCVSGYFETAGNCQACPAKCNGCQTLSVCTACAHIQRRLDQNCNCPDGFYDDNSAICKACNPLCKTCTTSTACTSCFTENSRSLSNGQCVCSSGYYQVVNTDNTVSCKRCSAECKTCSGPNVCLNCDASQNRVIGYDEMGHATCFCAPGFSSIRNGPCTQNGCTAGISCQACSEARGNRLCIKCIASTNRYLKLPQHQCICKEGYYEVNGICQQCASGCAKCSNATTCERCAPFADKQSNGVCNCPSTFFFSVDPIRSCQRCKRFCQTCNDGNSCDRCIQGFTATQSGECICAMGSYVNPPIECLKCTNNCSACQSETNCTLCATGYLLQEKKCVIRCSLGFYISGVTCESCQDGCRHCQRSGTCIICQPGRYAYKGLCQVNCPDTSIAQVSSMTCIPCNAPCNKCIQHPSTCSTCLTGNLFRNTCPDNCPVGYYAENNVCKTCSYDCAACLGLSTTCISCPETKRILFDGKCYQTCPVSLVNGKCPNVCPSGYFTQAVNGNCLKCNSRCRTCENDADRCTSCQIGVSSNGACVTACPANTLNVNGNCLPCAEGCNGCQSTVTQCSACRSGFFLVGSNCVASCGPGSFRDGSNGCRRCPDTCSSCTSATACTSCVEPRATPISGVCRSCISPCSSCTTFQQCTDCQAGNSLFNGRCVSQCPTGSVSVSRACRCTNGAFQNGQCVTTCPASWTNIDGTCKQCNPNCAQCSGSITTCTNCRAGFKLSDVTRTCEVNTNCQIGEYFSTESNVCMRICPAGYSYQETLCVSECLPGFGDNGFGGCVVQVAAVGCSFPYFSQQGSCVSTCNAGSYPNIDTRVCEACSSNCFSCFSSAFCTSCRSGFDLNSNICITGQKCASNRLKYNGVCLESCPVGTIASNGYCERRCVPNSYFLNNRCYTTCPTGSNIRTEAACVSQCPTGYILNGSVCKLSINTCASGLFYNAQTGSCTACASSCTECQFTSSYCTACASGLSLISNKCAESNNCGSGRFKTASGSCTNCPTKCLDCVSATECATCASNFVFNGADCVLKLTNWKEIQMTQTAVSRRNKIVFITIKISVIPNGLSNEQKNGFFNVAASENDRVSRVNQWISQTESDKMIVAVEYTQFPVTTSTLFIELNAGLLSRSLANVGYTASANSFLSVVVSNTIPIAPVTLNIPASATNSMAIPPSSLGYSSRVTASRVMSEVSIQFN